jgi:hypothetical protein
MKVVDSYCGIVILAVYFTYFLVVKGMLSAFDCTKNDDGIPFLDAEPSLRCDNVSPFAPSPSVVSFGFLLVHIACPQPPPVLLRIRKWAIASAVLYAAGIPIIFAWILFRYRNSIRADQEMRSHGQGNSRNLNPFFAIRQRYQKLYR